MHLRRHLAAPAALAVLIAGALSATATADPGRPADPSPGATAKVTASRAEARAALTEAQEVLSGSRHGDATMALRDLWLHRGDLTGVDRAAADRLLARPDDEIAGSWQTQCTADNCYHWLTSGPNAASPAYVAQVIETVDGVHDTYVAAGYRAPKGDGTAGGNAKTDIYLQNVYDQGIYGYCTSDMPTSPSDTTFDAWAYCVLDNDFAEFPTHTPLQNLQVTAAHEYFHAVQFGYDAAEDAWLMEATATWAEDELYTDVNDNLQYLPESPLAKPWQPLDTFNDAGAQYGTWIFFRFLTEQLPDAEGGLPTLVRDIWDLADGSAGGPDDYSMHAVAQVLKSRGVTLPAAYAAFATANRAPAAWYAEGADNRYPAAPLAGSIKLTSGKKDSGWKSIKLAHMSSATARFVPSTGLGASAWKLKVALDLPNTSTGSAAVVTVYPKSGGPQVTEIPLSSSGSGALKVAFGSTRVKYVEVTIANAGSSYQCWVGGAYSCQGTSKDDGRKMLLRATAVR